MPNSDSSITGQLWKSVRHFLRMANATCLSNCSGRGECQNGTCFCQVQFNGDSCMDPNVAYYVSFATIFYMIAIVSLGQLLFCIRSEYRKAKNASLLSACRVTTQKFLYVVTFIASTLRGAYFSSPAHADLTLSSSFMSAFYPTILTAGSLLVCFWAEAFHLQDIRCEKPRFLSKSFVGFLIFNIVNYSLFLTDIILTKETRSVEERSFLAHVFSGCYAVLLFIVLVFFLIYGVEVYFKVRGGFVQDTVMVTTVKSRPVQSTSVQEETETKVEDAEGLLSPVVNKENTNEMMFRRGTDHSQLQQSRFGLLFQALMFMAIVCFLGTDVLTELYNYKIRLMSRNAYDVLFRVVEIAVALWFPCCLWNCFSPEQLWILNPRKILKPLQIDAVCKSGVAETAGDCWICYDSEALDVGPLINPCSCKGDVGTVHHECLRRWLMECVSSNSTENLACKVCGSPYQLESSKVWWIGKGLNGKQWLINASLMTLMCGTIAAAWTTIHLCSATVIHVVAVGVTLVVINICLRCLGFSTVTAYQRAKISAAKILGKKFSTPDPNLSIISSGRSEDSSDMLVS